MAESVHEKQRHSAERLLWAALSCDELAYKKDLRKRMESLHMRRIRWCTQRKAKKRLNLCPAAFMCTNDQVFSMLSNVSFDMCNKNRSHTLTLCKCRFEDENQSWSSSLPDSHLLSPDHLITRLPHAPTCSHLTPIWFPPGLTCYHLITFPPAPTCYEVIFASCSL